MSKLIKSIYTDGACSGNPGPGGWGTVVYFADGSVHEMGGADRQTTNNRMEIQAAIAALEYLVKTDQSEPIGLYTDSEYVKNGITKWIKGWKQKGWKTSTNKPVLNQELWETLDQLNQKASRQFKLDWRYVKGHSGDVGNDRCDEIARAFSLGGTPKLQKTVDISSSPPNISLSKTIQSTQSADPAALDLHEPEPESAMNPASLPNPETLDLDLPREVRVFQLRNMVETLHMADEIAGKGYLITSSELADLMDVNASAVTSRGDNWVWRNWVVSRVRREGNQILWQLERVD
ncbi:MAG: ribonuclease HI [Drouetiella hepatica Uher 2000/2452]|jgi:ribonuclease HI|uniref:Ribonuclease H n=1 Tax=Drouetiella hepatica Uher 2000/2452 TaxID=904376 RepID=A0A951UPS4_9CYAN|nr:ribonuclease HI [Drouetiella hepatica Uher 2000/2452]